MGVSLNSGTGVYGEYGPLLMMNKDVVLVTLNYSMGDYWSVLETDQVPGKRWFWIKLWPSRGYRNNCELRR